MNTTEHELQTLLHTATSDLTPEVETLVAGGIARGRRQRRRRTAGSALAAVAVIGVIGIAASVAPGLVGDSEPSVGFATNDPEKAPEVDPDGPDLPLTVPAREIPGVVADMIPDGELGAVMLDPPYGIRDTATEKAIHFRWNGTLTTIIIAPASSQGTCAEQAAENSSCSVVDGQEVLTWAPSTADQVTAQGVVVWQHGWVVSAISYNAAEGKDVPPLMDAPAISLEQLTDIATSDVWFE